MVSGNLNPNPGESFKWEVFDTLDAETKGEVRGLI
jgi:hypothetical protein